MIAAARAGSKKRILSTALSQAALVQETKNDRSSRSGLGKDTDQQVHARRVFAEKQTDPNRLAESNSGVHSSGHVPGLPDLMPDLEDTNMEWLMNASPGTAVRSILGRGAAIAEGLNESPSKAISRYLAELPGINLDIPPFVGSAGVTKIGREQTETNQDELTWDVENDHSIFSPGSLSTPFRNAIFARAVSEQPPASHSRLLAQMDLNLTGGPPSSDDKLSGAGSLDLQINLLPPTADRRLALQAAQARNAHGTIGLQAAANDPLAVLDDFSSFLLQTSSSLFSPSPPRRAASGGFSPSRLANTRPSLPPLLFKARGQSVPLSHSGHSSDADFESNFDVKDLPPSSPPPLPSASAADVFTGSFVGQRAGTACLTDDGQSPISIGTSFTNGETPQEAGQPITQLSSRLSSGQQHGVGREYDWLDPGSMSSKHKNIIDLTGGEGTEDEDPLSNFFSSHSGTAYGHVSSIFSKDLTWSESTASSSSFVSSDGPCQRRVTGVYANSASEIHLMATSANKEYFDFMREPLKHSGI